MPILQYSNEIKIPVLMIHGEKAHSRYFSEDAFKKSIDLHIKKPVLSYSSPTNLKFSLHLRHFP